MDCPHCGSPAPGGATSCEGCGQDLPAVLDLEAFDVASLLAARPSPQPTRSPSGPGPAAPAPPAVNRPCTKCAALIDWPGGAWYCPACGAALAPGAERSCAPGSQGKKVCLQCRRVGPASLAMCPHCGGRMRSLAGAVGMAGVLAVVALWGLVVLGFLAVLLVPNVIRGREEGQFTACKSNLKNLATALEMSFTDNGSRYPASLRDLSPIYLKAIPTCPATGTYTYLYSVTPDRDAYTVVCAGSNHLGVGAAENHPQYSSVRGLIEK